MTNLPHATFQTLQRHGAEPQSAVLLPSGMAMVRWRNTDSEVRHVEAGHHTLSLYLRGGEQTALIRNNRIADHGFSGAMCLMPGQSCSHWRIGRPFVFTHLYFDDAHLQATLRSVWDRDSDAPALIERYLTSDPFLLQAALMTTRQDGTTPEGRMCLEHLGHTMLTHVAGRYLDRQHAAPRVRGRLGAGQARRVKDYVEAHLDRDVHLEDLAAHLNLSVYHFARLFRATFGQTPMGYVLGRRMLRAQRLLQDEGRKITAVALDCGFADHSAFSRAFRQFFGCTPQQMRHASRTGTAIGKHHVP